MWIIKFIIGLIRSLGIIVILSIVFSILIIGIGICLVWFIGGDININLSEFVSMFFGIVLVLIVTIVIFFVFLIFGDND